MIFKLQEELSEMTKYRQGMINDEYSLMHSIDWSQSECCCDLVSGVVDPEWA